MGRARAHKATAVVLLVGLAITASLTAAAYVAHERNESRLLRNRTIQVATTLEVALLTIQTPLVGATEVVEATDADRELFSRTLGPLIGTSGGFSSASVWRIDGSQLEPVFSLGETPKLAQQPPEVISGFIDRMFVADRGSLAVMDLVEGDEPRIGYAHKSLRAPRYMIYGERALSEDRTSSVPADSAFSGLDFALYFGEAEDTERILSASTPDLPISGQRASETIEFGDSSLLLVMSPAEELGGPLLRVLPWLVLIAGVVLALAASALVERLLRARDRAQTLNRDLEDLYEEQREVAVTLQRSLLPETLPAVKGVQIGVRYEPGAASLEVGGDWYDAVVLGDDRLMLTMGDVSGHGLRAASAMASLRYSVRAFGSQGDEPATILRKLNELMGPELDEHFATVVCTVIDLAARTVTFANAGHPRPLLLHGEEATFLETKIGPPIGVARDAEYQQRTVALPPGGTLLLFTDGLFERRTEAIDLSLEHLRQSAMRTNGGLQPTLDAIVAELLSEAAADDAAILGMRWDAVREKALQL